MTRTLTRRPDQVVIKGVRLRSFQGDADVANWLRIHESARDSFPSETRRWKARDFHREFLRKSWWNPARCWFAESSDEAGGCNPIGTVTRALRGRGAESIAVAHWLAVAPEWRRRGVASLLMSALEAGCWDDGFREVRLETLSSWTSAVAFYEARGYATIRTAGN